MPARSHRKRSCVVHDALVAGQDQCSIGLLAWPNLHACRQLVGNPDLTFEGSIGLFGWREIPAYVSERIVRDVRAIAADPAFRARFVAGGTASRSGAPEEFAADIRSDRALAQQVVKAAGLEPQ